MMKLNIFFNNKNITTNSSSDFNHKIELKPTSKSRLKEKVHQLEHKIQKITSNFISHVKAVYSQVKPSVLFKRKPKDSTDIEILQRTLVKLSQPQEAFNKTPSKQLESHKSSPEIVKMTEVIQVPQAIVGSESVEIPEVVKMSETIPVPQTIVDPEPAEFPAEQLLEIQQVFNKSINHKEEQESSGPKEKVPADRTEKLLIEDVAEEDSEIEIEPELKVNPQTLKEAIEKATSLEEVQEILKAAGIDEKMVAFFNNVEERNRILIQGNLRSFLCYLDEVFAYRNSAWEEAQKLFSILGENSQELFEIRSILTTDLVDKPASYIKEVIDRAKEIIDLAFSIQGKEVPKAAKISFYVMYSLLEDLNFYREVSDKEGIKTQKEIDSLTDGEILRNEIKKDIHSLVDLLERDLPLAEKGILDDLYTLLTSREESDDQLLSRIKSSHFSMKYAEQWQEDLKKLRSMVAQRFHAHQQDMPWPIYERFALLNEMINRYSGLASGTQVEKQQFSETEMNDYDHSIRMWEYCKEAIDSEDAKRDQIQTHFKEVIFSVVNKGLLNILEKLNDNSVQELTVIFKTDFSKKHNLFFKNRIKRFGKMLLKCEKLIGSSQALDKVIAETSEILRQVGSLNSVHGLRFESFEFAQKFNDMNEDQIRNAIKVRLTYLISYEDGAWVKSHRSEKLLQEISNADFSKLSTSEINKYVERLLKKTHKVFAEKNRPIIDEVYDRYSSLGALIVRLQMVVNPQ